MDELQGASKFLRQYREASCLAFVETWFNQNTSKTASNIDNFFVFRSDRTQEAGKNRGGGVCLYVNDRPGAEWEVTPIQVPDPNYDVDALNAAVNEELQSLDRTADEQTLDRGEVTGLDKQQTTDRASSHVEVKAVAPSGPRPATAWERSIPLQDLSPSEEWRFSLEEELLILKGDSKKTDHFCDVQLDSTIPGVDTRDSMSTKVQRSAGRMPTQSHTAASSHMLAYSRRYSDALRRAPPLRTPPSIPTPQPSARRKGSRGGSGPVLAELERHARRSRSPRNLMNTVNTLRSDDGLRPDSDRSHISQDPFMGMTLQVCRLPTSSRGRCSQVSGDTDFDFNAQLLQSLSSYPAHMSREPSFLHSINETQDYTGTGPQVSAYSQRRTSGQTVRKPTTAPSLEWARSQTGRSEDLGLYRNSTWTSIGSRQNQSRQATGIDPRTMIVGRPYSKAGRPIAQCSKVPDPDELFDAVVKQKEAAAAVDIQRIFRGYVARSVYKNLLSEEIKRKEDERRAAVKIQSMYRGHISRKQAIYNRSPLNPDLIKWSKDVKTIQDENSQKRQVKMEALANEMSENHRVAAQKISTIGPHVEVYDIYHPKKTGPTKKELNQAAIKIQKFVRGWMIRRKMEKLSRKAVWYGSNFQKMVKEYKTMLKRVQHQHGVDKASTPFSISDMNNYIDTRRRYESVFEKKSFGGELEHGDIEAFFRECDLYPSQAEVEEAMDVTMRGQSSKRDSKGLKKKELMDMIFYIYTPSATQLKGTRQSTWMSPIIEGQEARKLLGSEFVEPAPLAPCAKLVIDTKREQRLKEQAQKEADERRRINEEREKAETDLTKQQ
ncbi:abnormal spindle-like microcephaly-associated protein homolog [Elysia marginata]|uniref:Abnormal spindle-like microcephaly-associated protein homolog n=1 Tax=Elysia marginata TaxID=1093978 RepID=A0AAV4ILR7_9GAST|nr:abnormal spindle-like microcephaly-associated protein homolog [Elysia marginata]